MYGHWDIGLVGEFEAKDYIGFVYKITRKSDSKFYIGKKQFWSKRSQRIPGRVNKKWTTKESNWKSYISSNKELKSLNPEDFEFVILKLCKSKRDLSYTETKYQFLEDVLFKNTWNENIAGKYFKSHFNT